MLSRPCRALVPFLGVVDGVEVARRVLYRPIIHWVISSMLSSSLTAVWFWGRSRPASVACCATAWMSEPKLVAALPMRGPAKRFSSIQHTGHAHKLSTADGERVTTSDWPSVFSMDSGCSISFALSACSVFPSDSILPSIPVISSAPACSVRNAQLSGFAAAMPCDANNAKACAASRAWGESVGAWASTLREAATRPRGSLPVPRIRRPRRPPCTRVFPHRHPGRGRTIPAGSRRGSRTAHGLR